MCSHGTVRKDGHAISIGDIQIVGRAVSAMKWTATASKKVGLGLKAPGD
jgi:hypothetical protein